MINILLLILMITSAFAVCEPTLAFKTYLDAQKVFSSDDPRELLQAFSKEHSLTEDCAFEMAKKSVPEYAVDWVNKSKALGCFEASPAATCPDDAKKEIFGNISLLDQWGIWINSSSKMAPEHSLCTDLAVTEDIDGLVNSMSPILSILNKEEKIKMSLDLQKLNCEETDVVEAKDSPSKEYFEALLKKGMDAPLSEFLKLWYPDREKEFEKDPYLFNCQKTPWGNLDKFVMKENLAVLPEECSPDVLYSWGPQIKLDTMKKLMIDKETWSGSPNAYYGQPAILFMSISPISTYGYGEISIRVKLRKSTSFELPSYAASSQNAVYVRTDDDFHDFTTNESNNFESWSYGTPEQYDEMVRDIQRLESNKHAVLYAPLYDGWEGGTLPKKKFEEKSGVEKSFYGLGQLDGHEFTEKTLKQRLLKHIEMILNGEGRIHYQKGSCRNRDQHFRTKKRTYFNPH